IKTFENEGIIFSKTFIDRSFLHENKPTRKPGTGMLTEFFSDEYDLAHSYVIGDRVTDIQLAQNLGAKAIFINNGSLLPAVREQQLENYCALTSESWKDIYTFLV